jgi:hypothetical protein
VQFAIQDFEHETQVVWASCLRDAPQNCATWRRCLRRANQILLYEGDLPFGAAAAYPIEKFRKGGNHAKEGFHDRGLRSHIDSGIPRHRR